MGTTSRMLTTTKAMTVSTTKVSSAEVPQTCPTNWSTASNCQLKYLKACTKGPFIRSVLGSMRTTRPHMALTVNTYLDVANLLSEISMIGLTGCPRKIENIECGYARTLMSFNNAASFITMFKIMTESMYRPCGSP